ncbi:DUF2075 domain-containing protein [Mangrovivirga sp. M17]|uniref:DUF2075 domain-containing protein n=1 Tax=Mangrovivirga halotolerans TaxID=2993936 RepID=A0ABT3RQ45_9BACT|nr:DNA/RNA helicase domain-containing protein [Mangrovivirga halotolerans]MCX2743658.1 DUF2075 domain-containing protein [Mangrovivirga halotolerans]
MNKHYYIENHQFDDEIGDRLSKSKFSRENWPIVYILSDDEVKEAYIGETTDAVSRMTTHRKSVEKRKLTAVHIIESERFNKSATLDIESNLIKYMAGEGTYQLLNGNLGIANHTYFQKQEYWKLFNDIWDELHSIGIVKSTIEAINNSDLFKYSPYKALSTIQQKGVRLIIDTLLAEDQKSIVIKGGAGTGKTVIAVYLFKLLVSNLEDFNYLDLGKDEDGELLEKVVKLKEKFKNPKLALVVPMTSFRNTLKKVFSNVKGLRASMVVGPSEITKQKYDLIMVDEAHRLRRRKNLTNYKSFDDGNKLLGLDKETGNELDWMRMQAKLSVYFYDPSQSIKPTDVTKDSFDDMIREDNASVIELTSQFRVKGGNGYVDFVDALLNTNFQKLRPFQHENYSVKLFNHFENFVNEIQSKEGEYKLSRMIAGYSWEWKSKNDPKAYDIEIENVKLRWNRTNADWINASDSVKEVGCIHTTQGYDLNYAGIIFGHEIGYDSEKDEIIIRSENYKDKNGRNGIKESKQLKDYILNIYKTIMLRGIKGTYIYACDPELRKYLSNYVQSAKYKEEHVEEEVEIIPFVNSVPLYDLEAAAGEFSEGQFVKEQEFILVPDSVPITEDLFACKVVGESMNRIIPNGSICLFRKYSGGTRNGRIVLAQSSDLHHTELGSGYTVKEYYSKKVINEEGWEHEKIILRPLSNDKNYKDIELTSDDLQDFRVVGIFERVLKQ